MSNLALILDIVSKAIESSQQKVNGFQRELKESPFTALCACDNIFDKAAIIDVFSNFLSCIQTDISKIDEIVLEEIIVTNYKKNIQKRIISKAKFPTRSTSITANLADQAYTAANCELLEILEAYNPN